MYRAVLAFIVTLALLFGAVGATALAAQGALPDQALYPLKVAGEEFRLSLADMEGETAQFELYLELADERAREAAALAERGKPVPAQVIESYETLMEAALTIAAAQEDPAETQELLEGVMRHLRPRDQDKGQTNMPEDLNPPVYQCRYGTEDTEERHEFCDMVMDGLDDPAEFEAIFLQYLVDKQLALLEPTGDAAEAPQGDAFQGGVSQGAEAPKTQYGPGGEGGAEAQFGPGQGQPPQEGGPPVTQEPAMYSPGGDSGIEAQFGPGGEGGAGAQFGPGPESSYQDGGQAPAANQAPSVNGGASQKGDGKP